MTNQELVREDDPTCRRKEARYRTDRDRLRCETTIADCGLRRGSVIDVSRTGVRLLCEGSFEPGQPIFTELTTDRSHGIYRGVIRRVEPWKGGKSVLGCSLEDTIPDAVLSELADAGAVNRRTEDRVDLSKKAKLSWPLCQDEVDVELQDFSVGGMKIVATEPIPDAVRLRFRIEQEGESDMLIEAKSVWRERTGSGCVAGVAFTNTESSTRVATALGLVEEESDEPDHAEEPARPSALARDLAIAAGAAAACFLASYLV